MYKIINVVKAFSVCLAISLIYFQATATSSGAPRCSATFGTQTTANPLENTLAQLEARLIRVDQALDMTDNQTQRQAARLMSELRTLVENFAVSGDISDRNMAKLMELTNQLDRLEASLMDVVRAQMMDPFDLSRYLHTPEPILAGVEYFAEIQGLGSVRIRFSESVARLFSEQGEYRQTLFPAIFNGLTSRDQSGFTTTVGEVETINEVEYRVLVLKRFLTSLDRILVIHSSDGQLYFSRSHGVTEPPSFASEALRDFLATQSQE